MIDILWDSKVTKIERPDMVCRIMTGQTRGFANWVTSLSLQYPQHSEPIRDAVRAQLEAYAKTDANGIPNVPDIGLIDVCLPDGKLRTVMAFSVLQHNGTVRNRPQVVFRHVIAMEHEAGEVMNALSVFDGIVIEQATVTGKAG